MSNRLLRSRSRRSLVICVANNKPSAKHVRLSTEVIVTEQSATFSALAWAKIKNRQEDRMSRILCRSLNRAIQAVNDLLQRRRLIISFLRDVTYALDELLRRNSHILRLVYILSRQNVHLR